MNFSNECFGCLVNAFQAPQTKPVVLEALRGIKKVVWQKRRLDNMKAGATGMPNPMRAYDLVEREPGEERRRYAWLAANAMAGLLKADRASRKAGFGPIVEDRPAALEELSMTASLAFVFQVDELFQAKVGKSLGDMALVS